MCIRRELQKLQRRDIAYAKEFDSVIKLLAVARNTEDGIEAGVYPMMLPKRPSTVLCARVI